MKKFLVKILLVTTLLNIGFGCKESKNVLDAQNTENLETTESPRFKTETGVLRLESEKIPSTDHIAQMRKQPFIHKDELHDESELKNDNKNTDLHQYEKVKARDSISNLNSKKLYESALVEYYNQEYYNAVQILDQAIDGSPNYSVAYFKRGEAKSKLGDFSGAMKDFETAANSEKLKIDIRKVAHVHCGAMREKMNKHGEGIVHYDLAIQMDSVYLDAYRKRAKANQHLGNYEQAINDYLIVIDLDTGNTKVEYQLAQSYLENGEYKNSIKWFNKVIEKKPTYTPAYFYRGMANYELKKYHPALKDYDRVIQLDPKDEEAHFDRGLVFFELQMYKEALLEFETALELDPDDTDARINRALCKFQDGEPDAAIREFNKVLRQDSTNIDAHINIGIIEIEKEQYNKAKDHFTKVLEIDPENSEAYFYRGMANYETNDKRSACLDFEMSHNKKYPGAMHMIRQYCNDKGGN